MNISFEPFGIRHYTSARLLWEATPGVGLSAADEQPEIDRFLARNPGLSRVALCGGALAGTVLVGHDGRRGLIHHLAVHQDVRRRGIARALVRQAVSGLADAGIQKCHVLVFAQNTAGHAFWSAMGAEYRDALVLFSLSTHAAAP